MKETRLPLLEELLHFSSDVWKYKDRYGNERMAYKAIREEGSRDIVFYTVMGHYARQSWGGSIGVYGAREVVTRSKWMKEAAK